MRTNFFIHEVSKIATRMSTLICHRKSTLLAQILPFCTNTERLGAMLRMGRAKPATAIISRISATPET